MKELSRIISIFLRQIKLCQGDLKKQSNRRPIFEIQTPRQTNPYLLNSNCDTCVVETGFSEFYKVALADLKLYFPEQEPNF